MPYVTGNRSMTGGKQGWVGGSVFLQVWLRISDLGIGYVTVLW